MFNELINMFPSLKDRMKVEHRMVRIEDYDGCPHFFVRANAAIPFLNKMLSSQPS